MVSLDRRFMCQTIYSCCSFCVLSLALVIAIFCFDIRTNHLGHAIEVEGAQLIGQDWLKQPFVSYEVFEVASYLSCPGSWEEMVYDVWPGLMEVCFC